MFDPEELSLSKGFFGAEPWSEGLRARLESGLGITALDNYGCTEVLGPGVSFECERKDGLHVNEDCFIAVRSRRLGGEYARIGAYRGQKFRLPRRADASARHHAPRGPRA